VLLSLLVRGGSESINLELSQMNFKTIVFVGTFNDDYDKKQRHIAALLQHLFFYVALYPSLI